MTLEENIKHYNEKAEEQKRWATSLENESIERAYYLECAEDYEQLAKWLTELKHWQELKLVCAFDGYVIYKEVDNG